MNFLSDILLASAAVGAAVFCLVLSRRLNALTSLDSGMGKAIAVLSAQVDELSRALRAAQHTSRVAVEKLETQTQRAEAACRHLELLMASLHDLPAPVAKPERAAQTPTDHSLARPPSSWNSASARRPQNAAAPAPVPAVASAGAAGSSLRGPRVLRRRPGIGGV